MESNLQADWVHAQALLVPGHLETGQNAGTKEKLMVMQQRTLESHRQMKPRALTYSEDAEAF